MPRTDAADTAAHPTEAARDLIGTLVHCSETNGRSPTGGATVLGIDSANDLVLQMRDLSYPDTQLIRLGVRTSATAGANRLSYDDHGFGVLRRWANTTTPAGPDGPTPRRSRIEARGANSCRRPSAPMTCTHRRERVPKWLAVRER